MASAKCFMCYKVYSTNDPDDIAGDGKCATCKETSKQAALKVDIQMANRRHIESGNPIVKQWIESGGNLNARDLGISFSPD